MNEKGIRIAARRHIEKSKNKGQRLTPEEIAHKITSSLGFKIVRFMTGTGTDQVLQVVKGEMRRS